jgi:hypothetical protein
MCEHLLRREFNAHLVEGIIISNLNLHEERVYMKETS